MNHLLVPVTESSQPSVARRTAHELARAMSFTDEDTHRAGLVATELATNLVKHTRAGGEMLLRCDAARGEVEIIALDRGPGMDISRSMADGHSTSGSPGTGLGSARRLSDDFDIHSNSRGTAVLTRLRRNRARASRAPFAVAGVSVAVAGETACGDAWLVRPHRDGPIAAVVDGLGHGPIAADAARAAVSTLAQADFGTLPEALALLHDALRPTRGAALSLLQIVPGTGIVRFAGVGNVAGLVCQNGAIRRAVSLNGTLGHVAGTFREFSYPWTHDAVFVMYSDGLTSHWALTDYPGLLARDPALVAAVLYRDFSRGRDDVTVLVGRETT